MKNLKSYLNDLYLNTDDFDEAELLQQVQKQKTRKMKEVYDRENIYYKPDDYHEDR